MGGDERLHPDVHAGGEHDRRGDELAVGTDAWPADHPVPQAWLELDVESADAVAEAVAELQAAGFRLLRGAHEEPWGQTTSRLQSPEGLLVGITYTPWMHRSAPEAG